MPCITLFLVIAVLMTRNMVVDASKCPSCSNTSNCTTLDELYHLIKCKMPRENSEAYTVPSTHLLREWEQVVGHMMNGNCANLPKSLIKEGYTLEILTEASKTYCVLATFQDNDNDGFIDSPLGTVIVNQTPDPDGEIKDISIDIPHPLHDNLTGGQGIAVFQGTNARSLVLAGGHRMMNTATSTCQKRLFKSSDVAHNNHNTFQASVIAIMHYYEGQSLDYTAIQFHGIGSSTCANDGVFMTHGSSIAPHQNSKIQLLRDSLRSVVDNSDMNLGGNISMTGDSHCDMTATLNVQGRLINGVPPDRVCNKFSHGYTGRFIHVEQQRGSRTKRFRKNWIKAINDIDFTTASPPPRKNTSSRWKLFRRHGHQNV